MNHDIRQLHRAASEPIGPDDPRYADLVRRGFNKRFEPRPDYVRLVGSTADVVDAVQLAVRDGLRLVVRSGGHCLEGFVGDPTVRVLLDTSSLTGVAYDPERAAFAVDAGTTLGEVYRKLYLGWGVVLPAGQSPDVGIGGHALGSAFGFLHRQHGLAGDHLYAVEVVHVDAQGTARSVVATREASDPNRELWWAHTGGGGGNFGIVTRYWFRSPDSDGRDPARALPRAPGSVATVKAQWDWKDLGEAGFTTLVRNFGEWCEQHGDEASATATLFGVLLVPCPHVGKIALRALSIAGAEAHLDAYVAAIASGVAVAPVRQVEKSSWLAFAVNPFPDLFATGPGGVTTAGARIKVKDALLKRRHTDRQIGAMYRHLSGADASVGGGIGLATYGGRVNALSPDARAAAQRASVLETSYQVGWMDPAHEAQNLAWVRDLYREVFADSGGVPVPGPASDGALINHPDADLADPAWNRSEVPWHAIYYQDNYPRLQRVKARWDPRNVFHHALSIRLP